MKRDDLRMFTTREDSLRISVKLLLATFAGSFLFFWALLELYIWLHP